ncbi:hypothetical protein ElyMa_004235900 [Elysia marginata]|uniref:Uncharacterized protein n=1 Tax=Elysia marginata TaxID=1093978 RepID=A0AAV4GST9_9GAST|nr:hypothetical protein ElyMa_004235900 [Elysia marginata]
MYLLYQYTGFGLATEDCRGRDASDIRDSAETKAATHIQKVYRGHLGRKEYTNRLYARYIQEEQLRFEKMEQQVHEGQLLVNK